MKSLLTILFVALIGFSSYASENSDSTKKHIPYQEWETQFHLKNGITLTYEKPKVFDFATKVPKDMWGFCKYSFNKKRT